MICKLTGLDCELNHNGWCKQYNKQLKDVNLSEKTYCLEYGQPSMKGFAKRPEPIGVIDPLDAKHFGTTKIVVDELPEELKPKCAVVDDMENILKDIKSEKSIFEKAVDRFGLNNQIDILIEEMAELTQALSKYKRGKSHNIEEELVDVFIVLKQVKSKFDNKELDKWLKFKLQNLEMLVNDK